MLQKADVAGHQSWREEADHLPERIVPRHDGEHWAQGKIPDKALRGAGMDDFVGEVSLRVLGVIPADMNAFFNLMEGGDQRLAHLDGDQPRELLLFSLKNPGSSQHADRALREGGATVAGERCRRHAQLAVELFCREGLKDLNGLPVERIDSGNWHRSLL
jgi:hypothetical protein